ncbi:MAG: phosphoglucomutase/phosphomannomutase family protein [Chloroflexi bacterium]|nr:phosphoglucomutase/phosphomannomutase family protein [Chloroflexota bacterium]MYK61271.1 phosphoglucomutase/phosphomannomutase family protein [Chloroflexota bacterium]
MPPQPDIRFGTDGWRAIIGDDYTFANVRACAAAVARDLTAINQGHRGVAVGYDTRFQSENFARAAAEVIANHGIPVQISDRPLPTPALSYAVTTMNAAAGIMITASHNPPEYNGFKVKSEAGGSAPPDQVERIESLLAPFAKRKGARKSEATFAGDARGGRAEAPIQTTNMVSPYLDQLGHLVDIDRIKSAGIRVAVDSMHGSGAGIVAALLEGGATEVTEIRSEINPAFPGMKQPEPVEDNLAPLISAIKSGAFDVGIATDGDADRLGVVAENGVYVTTLEVFSMLFHHLKSRRKLSGGAACTITMSSMMDRLTEHHDVELQRTPVGFKFVGPAMIDNACVLGGEESGGYAFAGHVPERDGPLSALFFLESMAMSGKSPTELLAEIHEITGPHTFRRIDIEFTPDQRERITTAVNGKAPTTLGGIEVVAEDRRDGVRLDLQNNAWAVVRLSGTEPLLRIYAETSSVELRDAILNDFRAHLGV